ncbi:MAG: TrkA family potassium uptake protein [Clostridia bacterium]|nr:TrkA family potassium uptake protein [Clostridia bacterium]
MKKQKKNVYGIIGLGRFGTALAYKLSSLGSEILVLDRDEGKISEIREITENAFIVRNLEKKTLQDVGIQNCDVVIVGIASQMDVSILTVMKLLSLGVKKVIAKATSREHGEILEKIGAEVVYPESDMAIRLANRLEMGQGLDFIELSESINITKILVPKNYVGKTIREANLRGNFGLNIIAIENAGKVLDTITPDYVFLENDLVYLCGNKLSIIKLTEWSEENKIELKSC